MWPVAPRASLCVHVRHTNEKTIGKSTVKWPATAGQQKDGQPWPTRDKKPALPEGESSSIVMVYYTACSSDPVGPNPRKPNLHMRAEIRIYGGDCIGWAGEFVALHLEFPSWLMWTSGTRTLEQSWHTQWLRAQSQQTPDR
jgi:hypothetical protein